MSGREIYYLDSCIFLAWLRDEPRPPGEMDAVRDLTQNIQKNLVSVMTSTITLTEVTESKMAVGTLEMFNSLISRRNMSRIAVDARIARHARVLRDHYSGRSDITPVKKTLSVPDAIHIATAILYKATKFYTFDGRHSGNSLGLLKLNGDRGVNGLAIEKPMASQLGIRYE